MPRLAESWIPASSSMLFIISHLLGIASQYLFRNANDVLKCLHFALFWSSGMLNIVYFAHCFIGGSEEKRRSGPQHSYVLCPPAWTPPLYCEGAGRPWLGCTTGCHQLLQWFRPWPLPCRGQRCGRWTRRNKGRSAAHCGMWFALFAVDPTMQTDKLNEFSSFLHGKQNTNWYECGFKVSPHQAVFFNFHHTS